jgi:hypothetical protein
MVGQAKGRLVLRFEIEDPDTGRVLAVTAGVEALPAATVEAWIARIQDAPILAVRGLFRPWFGRKATTDAGRAWRIHASEIRIPPTDDGVPVLRVARAYALDHQDAPAQTEPAIREIVVTDLTPEPMRSHRGAYALAFQGLCKEQPLAILHPVAPGLDPDAIRALSVQLTTASRIRALGYFRPEIIRADQVVAWGFIIQRFDISAGANEDATSPPSTERGH